MGAVINDQATICMPKDFTPCNIDGSNEPMLSVEQLEDVYLGRKTFVLDSTNNVLGLTSKFNEDEYKKVSIYFLDNLKGIHWKNPMGIDVKHRRIELASLHFKDMSRRYEPAIALGYKACKSDAMPMIASEIDRYLAAIKFASIKIISSKESDLFVKNTDALSVETTQQFFSTKIAKDMVAMWAAETIHRAHTSGKSRNSADDKLVHSEYVCNAFLHHPEEIDCLRWDYNFRKAARFNMQITIGSKANGYHHQFSFNGSVPQNVSSIMQQKGELPLTVDYAKGLVCYDPEIKDRNLAIFKARKPGKAADDYRVVVKTIIDENHSHCWLELKDPQYRYTVGYRYKIGERIPLYRPCESVQGEVINQDECEFLGHDDKITKTSIAISPEQFIKIKNHIESIRENSGELAFNLVSKNCTSFVREMLSEIDIRLPSKDADIANILGYRNAEFTRNTPRGNWYTNFLYYIIGPFRNAFMYLIGGSHSVQTNVNNTPSGAVFNSPWDVLNPVAGDVDSPRRVQQWQKYVEQQRDIRCNNLRASNAFNSLSCQEQSKEIDKIRYGNPNEYLD